MSRYPLKLRPIVLPKVWGGRRLEQLFGRQLPGRGPIGEAWVAWDGLKVTNGKHAGATLARLTSEAPDLIFSQRPGTPVEAAFPLLVKFLDARENLSIQVHPDDIYARARENQPFGKCEMWYILAADPGAVVIQGVKREITSEELVESARDGRIVDLLEHVPVRPGDVLINSPGTIHALRGGVVIFELQQSCDLTYRIYDWDRGGSSGRALHLNQAVDVSDLRPMAQHLVDPVVVHEGAFRASFLAAGRYFAAELLELPPNERVERAADQFRVITVVEGECAIRHRSLAAGVISLRSGQAVVIPRALGDYHLATGGAHCRVIESYVPDLARDVVAPLRARGITDKRIAGLGGDPSRSDLRAALEATAL